MTMLSKRAAKFAQAVIFGIALALAFVACGSFDAHATTLVKPLVLAPVSEGGQQRQIKATDTPWDGASFFGLVHGTPTPGDCALWYDATHVEDSGTSGCGSAPGGSSGQIEYNNAGAFGGFTPGGDLTFANPNFTVTKIGGATPSYFATGTDAANLTGTVACARLPSFTGDATNTLCAISVTKTGGVAFGYFATGTDAANLTGTVPCARLPALTGDATNTLCAISVTKTGGVAFGYFATGTDAANLTGTVPCGRLPALTGDATNTLCAISVTKTGGVAFGYFATGLDASNLTGTLAAARLPAFTAHAILLGTGSAGAPAVATIGTAGRYLRDNGAGVDPSMTAIAGGDLPIGSSLEAWSANLDALAALSTTGKLYYLSAAHTWSQVTIGAGITFSGGTLSATGGGGPPYCSLSGCTMTGDILINPGPLSNLAAGYMGAPLVNAAHTTSYTLALTDAGAGVVMNCSSACTVTIPLNATVAFPVGTIIPVVSIGAGGVTITPAVSVNLYANGATSSSSVSLSKNTVAPLHQPAVADNWLSSGSAGTGAFYYAGSNTPRTYDPGVGTSIILDSCTITVPAAGFVRTFLVEAYYVFSGGSATHGQFSSLGLDSGGFGGTNAPFVFNSSIGTSQWQDHVIATVPGDNATHTITLLSQDAGSTGNLNFYQRWITARQISP
jgi:hypothetical protein